MGWLPCNAQSIYTYMSDQGWLFYRTSKLCQHICTPSLLFHPTQVRNLNVPYSEHIMYLFQTHPSYDPLADLPQHGFCQQTRHIINVWNPSPCTYPFFFCGSHIHRNGEKLSPQGENLSPIHGRHTLFLQCLCQPGSWTSGVPGSDFVPQVCDSVHSRVAVWCSRRRQYI